MKVRLRFFIRWSDRNPGSGRNLVEDTPRFFFADHPGNHRLRFILRSNIIDKLIMKGADLSQTSGIFRRFRLCSQFDVGEPLRGELVELQNLEQRHGWLAELLTDRPLSPSVSARAAPAGLGVMQSDWSQEELQAWYEALAGLIERMSDSLDEW
jgi:hypothetical protein